MKSLNQIDRECEEKEDYNWGDCLDEMFYLKKGCQDPWNVNPKVPLRVCTNVTEIKSSYWDNTTGWLVDQQFWDRPFMSERELASIKRGGKRCKTPCTQTHFHVKSKITVSKDK